MYAEGGTTRRTTIYVHPAGLDGLLFEQDTGTAGLQQRHFLSVAGETIGVAAFNGSAWSTQYWHKDHLGSINVVTNDSAAVQERLEYEPFGKRRYPNGTTDVPGTLKSSLTNRGFTGHEELDEVGLVHMNGRVYDPSIGRFASADPFVQAPFNPQSLNRYSYVFNNPLSLTDPTGYEATGESSAQGEAQSSASGTDDGSAVASAAGNPSGFDLGVDNSAKSPKANADANVVAPNSNCVPMSWVPGEVMQVITTARRLGGGRQPQCSEGGAIGQQLSDL